MPTNQNQSVSIELPPGMAKEDVEKAFQNFLKAKVTGQIKDKASRAALKELISVHQKEFETLVAKYTPKS